MVATSAAIERQLHDPPQPDADRAGEQADSRERGGCANDDDQRNGDDLGSARASPDEELGVGDDQHRCRRQRGEDKDVQGEREATAEGQASLL